MQYDSALPPVPAKEIPATWEDGVPRMSPDWLRKVCVQTQGFETPSLNTQLSLQYKGIRKIEGLKEYTSVKSLFLDCNGIKKMENLEPCAGLVQLYLQQNCVEKIENLHPLVNLLHLNLAHNMISVVENLDACKMLETLNLASNKIIEVENLRGLAECPSLKSVDVSCNYIDDGDALIKFWPDNLPNLECLYLHHNPCSSKWKDYRRRMISSMPNLRFLDQRPAFDLERVGAEAWSTGGKDGELLAQQKFYRDQLAQKSKSFNQFTQTQALAVERIRAGDGFSELGSSQPQDQRLVDAELENKMRIRKEISAFLSANGGHPLASVSNVGSSGNHQEIPASEDIVEDAAPASELSRPIEVFENSLSASSTASTAQDGQDTKDKMSDDTFTWSGLRDHRLGRLVAAHHYNMEKAAEALSQEFMCRVSKEECRKRYTELKTLQGSNTEIDEEAAKKDASQWWLRQLDKVKEVNEERKQKMKELGTHGRSINTQDNVEAKGSRGPEAGVYYDMDAVEEEMQKAEAAGKASANTWTPSSHSGTASNLAANQSLFSPDPGNSLNPNGDHSSASQASSKPCPLPRAFAPPARGGKPNELGELD
jgi:dynein assembly factor 1